MLGRLQNWKQGREELNYSAKREGNIRVSRDVETEPLWRKVKGEATMWLRRNFAGRVEIPN